MAGGVLYQLSNYSFNSKNNYLEIDPEISFFKVVYRRHTRFAIENIILNDLTRTKLNYSEKIISKCNISRNADLLSNLYLTFELPNIYSGSYTNESYTSNYEFKWIENIGINICNYIKLNIDSNTIDSLTSDYINIWKELILSDDEKQIFNKNIGHIEELYEPKNSPGQNGVYPNITKGNTLSLQSEKWNNHQFKVISKTSGDFEESKIFPSIIGKKIKVPLPFYFMKNHGLSLPLIALQYSQVSLELEFNAFKDLYTINDPKYTNPASNSLNKRIKPSSESYHNMTDFAINYDYDIKAKIEGEFVYLDEAERKRFSLYDHEYLITQNKLVLEDGSLLESNKSNIDIKLTLNHPMKYLAFIAKRDDFKNVNIINNYTNWIYPNIPPYSIEYLNKEKYYDKPRNKDLFYNPSNSDHKTLFNTTYLRKNILSKAQLIFDGNTIVDKDIEYFENQQKMQYFKKNSNDGIYIYSFSINPNEYQPSGSCNFDSIHKAILRVYQPDMNQYNYYHNSRIYVYGINYNILVITNGSGNLKFS